MSRAAPVTRVETVERTTIQRDPFAYCAHPHLAVAADGAWLLVFNRVPRRGVILHPPQDPDYRNVLMRSQDEGRSWSAPSVVPDYGWAGVECAGLTALRSGRILLNQWRFEWLPLAVADARGRTDVVRPEELMAGLAASPELDVFVPNGSLATPERNFPWVRGGGDTVVHLSDDGGRSFVATSIIDTGGLSGGYGMRGAVELPDGDILLPLSDVPHYKRLFVVRSRDGGTSWSAPLRVADAPGQEFEEPAPLLLASGRVLMLLRDNGSRILHAVWSDDGGRSWTPPRPTGIEAYPAHLLALPDGRIACIAGRRQPPFGIVAHFSEDGGETWDDDPLALVDDLPTKDLGYPTAALRRNGDLHVVYYAQDTAGITGIHAVTARLR
ncbi:exo-alpha-sialidase [Ancylobacter terrae]|uniref:exo-alpha-sialidase n=1 Tax=Ancylobacter sp. sgz301288 TaxID=3342077 RepID=UPI00385B026C